MKRKTVPVLAALVVVLWSVEAWAHRHVPRELVESFVTCWNTGDIDCVTNLVEDNGDLSEPLSSYASGREQIKEMLLSQKKRSGELGRIELDANPLRTRLFTTSHALVDWSGRMTLGQNAIPLLISANIVPTKVSASGEIEEFSFRSLRLIRTESAAAKK